MTLRVFDPTNETKAAGTAPDDGMTVIFSHPPLDDEEIFS